MAGAGYKLFNTGDVLTAAQVNTYLMQQTVMVFADSSARTTALSGVLAEGMLSYLQDTDATEVYNGSAWVALAADQTPLTTKGDLFTYTTADARLPVGTNGQYLSANSSTSTGLEWVAAPTSTQNWSVVAGATSLSGNASVTISGISSADKLMITMANVTSATSGGWISLHINDDTSSIYDHWGLKIKSNATYSTGLFDQYTNGGGVPLTGINLGKLGAANKNLAATVFINGGNSAGIKVFQGQSGIGDTLNANEMGVFGGRYTGTSTISSLSIKYNDGNNNFSDGYIYVWKSA